MVTIVFNVIDNKLRNWLNKVIDERTYLIKKRKMLNKFISCKVDRVIDGDTIVVDNGITIRLADIDAPEVKQKFGKLAKKRLEYLLKDGDVYIYTQDKGKYGRLISTIYIRKSEDDNKLTDINRQLVGYGLAFPTERKYQDVFEDAKKNKRGAHMIDNFVSPSEFRKKNKSNKRKF
jgi:micrococcal nuclease